MIIYDELSYYHLFEGVCFENKAVQPRYFPEGCQQLKRPKSCGVFDVNSLLLLKVCLH
jgi:hypothetical protein